MEEFRIPSQMAREIVEHAQSEYPKECCGAIVGRRGALSKLYRITNVHPDPVMRFTVNSQEWKRMEAANHDLVWDVSCIYHSHTHTGAFPSATDIEYALNTYPGVIWVIVSLQDRARPEIRAFQIMDGKIDEFRVVETEEVAT